MWLITNKKAQQRMNNITPMTHRICMKSPLKPVSVRLALALVAGLAFSTVSSQAQTATATISDVAAGGNFDYTITLDNTSTGSLTLNSFWYGWIQFEDDLPTTPISANNSLGWANDVDGNSIQWVNSTGTALQAGHTATFTFVDSSTPAQITAGISGESVAYVGSIDFSQGSAGDSTGIFTPVLVVPEPSSVGLLAAGLGILGISLKSRKALRAAKARVE
jgi:hypothetical protein